MANIYYRASVLQINGKGGEHAVRTCDSITALQQEAGNCGKSAAPDANEVYFCHDK
jgi:hypothetical protein